MNAPPISVLGHAPMKTFFLRFFTWWNGATFGTLVWTSLYGEFVGEDEFGNRYYRTRGGKIDPTLGYERRWVIYNGTAEASIVPPSWHGWLHHTVDTPPTQEEVTPRPWWKPHRPNLTGTPAAHRPRRPAPPPPHRPHLARGPRAGGARPTHPRPPRPQAGPPPPQPPLPPAVFSVLTGKPARPCSSTVRWPDCFASPASSPRRS